MDFFSRQPSQDRNTRVRLRLARDAEFLLRYFNVDSLDDISELAKRDAVPQQNSDQRLKEMPERREQR
jgi:hypothetical protein